MRGVPFTLNRGDICLVQQWNCPGGLSVSQYRCTRKSATVEHPGHQTNLMTTEQMENSPLAGKRAVICEDEGIIVSQVRSSLRRAGVDVVGIAKNGVEAVEVVLREKPDIVLMDVRMPERSGLEAMEEIKKSFHPCFVMLTAFAGSDTVERALELGAYGYIVKPVDSMRIISAVASAVNLANSAAHAEEAA